MLNKSLQRKNQLETSQKLLIWNDILLKCFALLQGLSLWFAGALVTTPYFEHEFKINHQMKPRHAHVDQPNSNLKVSVHALHSHSKSNVMQTLYRSKTWAVCWFIVMTIGNVVLFDCVQIQIVWNECPSLP